jgi:hypothetical protein
MRIVKYQPENRNEWDAFVRASQNGTFLFCRDFMEYHADRFADCSLLCYERDELAALLPGNRAGDTFYSHQGLTYGGFILQDKVKAVKMMNLFSELIAFLHQQGVKKMVYKAIPHIYHRYPAEADLYALFRYNATLTVRSISSVIDSREAKPEYAQLRKRQIKKAASQGISIGESDNFTEFWHILEENLLAKHDAKPVHSLQEIERLKSKFPDEIRLFVALKDGKTLAGCVIFDTPQVAHTQYISANEEGKRAGALDAIFNYLINCVFASKKYFDFGTSTEDAGRCLNAGLIAQKEGFGARSVVYDCYEVDI